MSFRFSIRETPPKAQKEGEEIIKGSGISEPYRHSTERQTNKVGIDGAGNAIVRYVTGLDTDKVDLYRWLTTDEERELMRKQIDELRPLITKAYGGDKVVEETNKFFWGRENKEVNRILVHNATDQVFMDTKTPSHALLYLSIMAGAFMEVVAPTKDWAEAFQVPHYLALETDDNQFDGDEDITRSEAHAALISLQKESPEALMILSWCVLSDTTTFGGVNKATSQRELMTSLVKFIDGKLVSRKKRNCPKTFMDYAERWKKPLTKNALYVEAYLRAGEHFALINQREKRYTTANGTALGNTVKEAVETLLKPKFQVDLEQLRDAVETKWTE